MTTDFQLKGLNQDRFAAAFQHFPQVRSVTVPVVSTDTRESYDPIPKRLNGLTALDFDTDYDPHVENANDDNSCDLRQAETRAELLACQRAAARSKEVEFQGGINTVSSDNMDGNAVMDYNNNSMSANDDAMDVNYDDNEEDEAAFEVPVNRTVRQPKAVRSAKKQKPGFTLYDLGEVDTSESANSQAAMVFLASRAELVQGQETQEGDGRNANGGSSVGARIGARRNLKRNKNQQRLMDK